MTISIDRWLDHWARPLAGQGRYRVRRPATHLLGPDRCRGADGIDLGRCRSWSRRPGRLPGRGRTSAAGSAVCLRPAGRHLRAVEHSVGPPLSFPGSSNTADPAVVLTDVDHAEVLAESVAGSTRGVRRACRAASPPGLTRSNSLPSPSPRPKAAVGRRSCVTPPAPRADQRGAVLTHEALLANATNVHAMMDMTSHDRVLNTMPLFHVGGLNVHSLPTLAAGGTIVLHPRFDPARVLAELTAGDVDLVTLLPPHAGSGPSHCRHLPMPI